MISAGKDILLSTDTCPDSGRTVLSCGIQYENRHAGTLAVDALCTIHSVMYKWSLSLADGAMRSLNL